MSTYLINYIKRDTWLRNGRNYGMFLREIDKLENQGMPHRKAKKLVNNTLWRSFKKC